MKYSLLFVFTLLLAHSAFALGVGDSASSVKLDQVGTDGRVTHHSITDSQASGQAVVLEFFQITCPHCIASFEAMNQAAADLGQKATFRLVLVNGSESDLQDFTSKNPNLVQHETAIDADWEAAQDYEISETPTVFVLNSKNRIIYQNVGLVTTDIAQAIEQAAQNAH